MFLRTACALAFAGCVMAAAAGAQPPQRTSLKSGDTPLLEQKPAPNAVNDFLVACLGALASGRPVQAEQACSQAIALDPQAATGYKLRGYVYLIEHRFERAEADFRVALKFQPDDAESRAGYGQSLSGLGQFPRAIGEFSRAVALAPESAAYRNGLCWARAGTGKNLKTALADCNRALALAPGTPGPLNSRGLVKLRLGRLREAIADYDASLAARPAQPSARFARGLAKLGLRQAGAGITDIDEARRTDPQIDELYIGMGILDRGCGPGAEGAHCPRGFPPRAEKGTPGYPWLVVALRSDPQQDYVQTIEAGRLDSMVDQIALILGRRGLPPQPMLVTAGAGHGEHGLRDQISATMTRFQALMQADCSAEKNRRLHCHLYRPGWGNVLQADAALALDEAYSRVGPVWSALCAGRGGQCRVQ